MAKISRRDTRRSARDLNNPFSFSLCREGRVNESPYASFEERRWSPQPSVGPVIVSPSQAQRPENLREEVTLEGGRPVVPASLGSLTEGQQYAAEAQHPQGPHGARRKSLKSLLIAGAASTPPTLRISSSHLTPRGPPTTPKQVRLLFTPLLEGGGRKHKPTNRAAPRTLFIQWGLVGGTSVHQSELSRCGAQCPKRGSFRLVIRSLSCPIKWLRGPSHTGPPLCLGSFGLCGKLSNKRQLRTHPSFRRGRRRTTSGS